MNNIAIQGICYDDKSSFLKGPRLAPPLIREILNNGSSNSFAENGVDISDMGVIDKGDFAIADYDEIESIAEQHLNDHKRLLTLGGDHSITFPIIKAYCKFYSRIEILHIDAHSDLYHLFEGDPYSHACPFARIMEGGYASRLVQLGIRTLNTHQREQAKKYKVEIVEMKDWSVSNLPVFRNPLYISLDMDAFDPAYAPGVSHHEPGGFTSREVISILRTIKVPVIGADIVEYNPERDVQRITGALAAKMMKELLGIMGHL